MNNPIVVSSWSLHRTIGTTYHDSPAGGPKGKATHSETPLDLLELPKALRDHGYSAMQLCHFHLPSREEAFISEFRAALDQSGIKLWTLLIDEGDITDAASGQDSADWISSWVRTAAQLGTDRARVIAGKQKCSTETMDLAVTRLKQIAAVATEVGVRIETENWFDLLATPSAVNEILDRMEGQLGLCADFGNWPRPFIYEALPQIMGRAETCHAKFEFVSASELDEAHSAACLKIAEEADYKGPFVIVNGGASASEWDAIDTQRKRIKDA